MTSRMLQRIILLMSAVALVAVGAGAAIAPHAFYTGYEIVLAGDVNLASELRAAGLALLVLGTVVGAGAFVPRLALVAALVGAASLLAYAGGRLISWLIDGVPSSALVVAGVVELALGAACLFVLVRMPASSRSARRLTSSYELSSYEPGPTRRP